MRNFHLLFVLSLLLSACDSAVNATAMPTIANTAFPTLPSATATPTSTAVPMPSPTLTSTPVPPLAAHQWSQSEPLITWTNRWGDGGCPFQYALPVEFTLLPTGDLYLRRWNDRLSSEEIVTTRLSQQATCSLLNSIDQAGFFDYDPSTYVKDPNTWIRPVAGPDNTSISVHAWRAKSVSLFFLPGFLDPKELQAMQDAWAGCTYCPEYPTILPAIRDTYRLLHDYQPPRDVQPLGPGRLGVWVYANPDPISPAGAAEWPLKSHTLADAASLRKDPWDPPVMILTGTEATRVSDALHQSLDLCGTEMREDEKLYTVFARPLLPNEFGASPLPVISLSCSPADGLVGTP